MMKLFVLFGLVLAACADTIWETAVKTEQLSSLVEALNTTENKALVDALNQTDSTLTLFAPSNVAFAKPHDNLTDTVVKFHLLGAVVNSADLSQGPQFVTTATTQNYILEVIRDADSVLLQFDLGKTSKVTTANVVCAGGIVHIVDTILVPPKKTSQLASEAGLNQFIKETTRLDIDVDVQLKNVTVFAPTDAAFNASSFDAMGYEPAIDTIEYHVLAGRLYSIDLKDGQELTTLLGDKLLVQVKDGKITVGGANIEVADAIAENSVVHVIGSVLRVPFSPERSILKNLALQADTTSFSALLNEPALVDVKNLLDTAANITIFAPSNAALVGVNASAIPTDVLVATLQYHVLPVPVTSNVLSPLQFPATLMANPKFVSLNKSAQVLQVTEDSNYVKVNNATVTTADLMSESGVVAHVINQLLAFPEATAVVAKKSGLNILLEQVVRAGIDPTIADITILAPSDEAFNNYGNVSEVNVSDVKGLLLNHIIQGSLNSLVLGEMTTFTTLGNTTYTITKDTSGAIKLDGANVLVANVLTENGVVHVIDRVLGSAGPAPKPKPPSGGKGVPAGAVVGIVVGVLAGVAIVGYCCFKSSNEDGYKPM